MDTYTFIAEYNGVVFISQAKGLTISEACIAWGKLVIGKTEITLKNKATFVKILQNDLDEMPPACLDDMPNVWYFLADAGKGYVHVNAVKTHASMSEWHKPESRMDNESKSILSGLPPKLDFEAFAEEFEGSRKDKRMPVREN
ncbi:MAG: hypothetical protein ACKVU0_02635 [Saprospiraceae bacterium]